MDYLINLSLNSSSLMIGNIGVVVGVDACVLEVKRSDSLCIS